MNWLRKKIAYGKLYDDYGRDGAIFHIRGYVQDDNGRISSIYVGMRVYRPKDILVTIYQLKAGRRSDYTSQAAYEVDKVPAEYKPFVDALLEQGRETLLCYCDRPWPVCKVCGASMKDHKEGIWTLQGNGDAWCPAHRE